MRLQSRFFRFSAVNECFVSKAKVELYVSGKRMCVGEEFARTMTYIFVAALVKNFKIEPCTSSPIDFSGVCGISLVPKPQKVVFVKILFFSFSSVFY